MAKSNSFVFFFNRLLAIHLHIRTCPTCPIFCPQLEITADPLMLTRGCTMLKYSESDRAVSK
jgi:hypothetical protein